MVEGARLEIAYSVLSRVEGSNPSYSASFNLGFRVGDLQCRIFLSFGPRKCRKQDEKIQFDQKEIQGTRPHSGLLTYLKELIL